MRRFLRFRSCRGYWERTPVKRMMRPHRAALAVAITVAALLAACGDDHDDGMPDAFSFTAVTAAPLSSVHTSNAVKVSGINKTVSITIVGGSYSVNGGTYTSAAGTVKN